MGWLKKKADPISERAHTLNSEIAALEAQIKRLDAHLHRERTQPRLRSTAVPRGATIPHTAQAPGAAPAPPAPKAHEPVFEDVDQNRLKTRPETATPDHYNELGVRKYDFPAFARRVRSFFQGSSTMNPKLVSYLAAGGIQGLRPMRYEKRVARNRVIGLTLFLLLLLLGIIYVIKHNP